MYLFSHSCSPTARLTHLHTLQQQQQQQQQLPPAPTRLFGFLFLFVCLFVVIFFPSLPWCDSSSPNGWHCDHGCHTTRAVFSKTAEDSLAHVTTASRLTCYHGDKQANENSADGCDVDCKLFVLRGDLFFSLSLPPPPPSPPLLPTQLLRRRPCYSVHVHTDVHTDKKNMGRLLTHTHTHTPVHAHTRTHTLLLHVKWGCKVVHKEARDNRSRS